MKKEYKDKFPEWCSEFSKHYDLVLGDDSDSLLVNNILEIQTWNSTRFFYDFEMLYIEKGYAKQNPIIGCDIDFIEGRCWGNHVTAISNSDIINTNSANLNNIDKINSKTNYTSKYAGSTLATVMSYYDYDISKLSEQAKMLILCIDSHYFGFYTSFHNTQKKWLMDVLQYPELYDIILKYKEQDFIDLAVSLNIKIPTGKKDKYGKEKYRDGKIWINEDGYLETEINLKAISDILGIEITLPKIQFEPYFKKKEDEPYLIPKTGYANTQYIRDREQIQENIFSYSQTYKNSASYTYLYKIKPKQK
ncbi:hypothetical protein [Tissierella praeacuta]|uniref:hypothetical protein n=1 Tax=Tissierella praeacuta TaxID=43131 RepID=UPI0028A9221E|nr:hypothetical protein [Tissierella praeacuta]